jgi:hypothetical protein
LNNPYLELTEEFNRGRLRALLSSGQAVVVHRLAVTSKDGDWILREDAEATAQVLTVLERRGARYRFGAPLDPRWLAGGWSSHFESQLGILRLRTDFVTRPPRVSSIQLEEAWREAERQGLEVVGLEPLAALKLTRREKDYPTVGELARLMGDPVSQLLYSRSSRDLIELAQRHPRAVVDAAPLRPLLRHVGAGREALDEALDRERRQLMRADEDRLSKYGRAAEAWAALWPRVQREIEALPLAEAHALVVSRAAGVLPFVPTGVEP